MNVIVVDDDQEFLKSADVFLSIDPKILAIGVAISGGDALGLIERLPYKVDVILTDLAMPGMNRLEPTRRLKSKPEPPRVLILTLRVCSAHRDTAVEAGPDGIIEKPEIPDSMLPLINNLFNPQYAMEENI